MGNISSHLSAKAGGMADVSATLVQALYDLGADVHVAIPHYRQMYKTDYTNKEETNQKMLRDVIQGGESDHVKRVHLASSRLFNTSNRVYGCTTDECLQRSLAFQREVINTIIPEVNPDLIHCNDWMTGLIPSFARILGIRSLFTVHNIHTVETTLERITKSTRSRSGPISITPISPPAMTNRAATTASIFWPAAFSGRTSSTR